MSSSYIQASTRHKQPTYKIKHKAMLALQSHTCIGYRDHTHFYKDYGNILSLSSVLPVHLEARTKWVG